MAVLNTVSLECDFYWRALPKTETEDEKDVDTQSADVLGF